MPKLGPATITSPARTSRGELGPHGFQAMRRDDLDAVLHAWPGAEWSVSMSAPRRQTRVRRAHASTSRGSVMRPRSADAATVYGEPR